MSNAPTAVAQRGWELFRATNPRPTLDQVNVALVDEGLEPVSYRTHRHYRRLDQHGLVDYMPINELDVMLKFRGRNNPGAS
jgi:hypothetical protein